MHEDNRSLTYDEKKAAEAAFNGSPFDPKWSESAHQVYLGISLAMADKQNDVFQEDSPLQTPTELEAVS
jgi:hypothetical protein